MRTTRSRRSWDCASGNPTNCEGVTAGARIGVVSLVAVLVVGRSSYGPTRTSLAYAAARGLPVSNDAGTDAIFPRTNLANTNLPTRAGFPLRGGDPARTRRDHWR